MKVGIYITGLGQSFEQVPAQNYTERLLQELNQTKTGITFSTKTEKIQYNSKRESNVVTIIEDDGQTSKPIYKIYDFKYNDILTKNFVDLNILVKSFTLFLVVVKKFPTLLRRMLMPGGYNKPFQIFYLFGLFFIMGLAILFMIPAGIDAVTQFLSTDAISDFIRDNFGRTFSFLRDTLHIRRSTIEAASKNFISISAIILILLPQAKTIITMLATEFVCAHKYLDHGKKRQEIFGNLDSLVEYIAENERGSKIHFHTYSFGSIIAIDYLFTFGNVPSDNVLNLAEGLVTVGTPFDFIKTYYSDYTDDRNFEIESKIKWINVYSVADALGSNFRKDTKVGEAQVGVREDGLKPVNINYEIMPVKKFSIWRFLSLHSIKAHSVYWDFSAEGQTCLRLVYKEMVKQNLM